MPTTQQTSTSLFGLGLVYLLYFSQLGIMVPYIGVMLDGRGFSSAEIGELIAMITLTRVVGPNLWAALADKTGHYLPIIRIGSLLAVLSFLLLFWFDGYWGIALSMGLMMMFWTAILPQLEVVTLTTIAGDSGLYSKIRLWGSIGYILCSVVLGYLLDWFHSDVVIWASVTVLAALFLSTLPISAPRQSSQHNEVGSMWQKLKAPVFMAFILSAILLQVSFGPFYGFFALYMLDIGYSGQQTGWFIALGVMAEVIIFLLAGRIISRFGIHRLLLICLLLAALRWYLLATLAGNILWLVFSQLLHAASFGLAHAASIQFIHRHFGKKFQSRGQAIYASIAFGGGGAIGNYVAGQLWHQGQGATATFIFASAAAGLAALVLLLVKRQSFAPPMSSTTGA
ncbi:MFS transporter [Alteromonadaceae bacterium BrNp21-10]|nr:MFS transporter [Alteromonadaceae bacterium BrNp21-10]